MVKATLNVQTRETKGKGAARTLRREGTLPGVVYKAGESIPLSLNEKDLMQLFKKTKGRLTLLNLMFQDKTSKLVMYKECQVHPVHGNVMHVDFQEIGANEKITLLVGVSLIGDCIGVKRDAGILEHRMRQLEITCVPDNVPAHIDIDITDIEAGQSIHVSDITAPEGVTIVSDAREVILAVTIPALIVETEEEIEGEEGAEAAEGAEVAESAEGESKDEPAADKDKS